MRRFLRSSVSDFLIPVFFLPILLGSSPAYSATADHLLISEVVTKTRAISGGRLGSEFVELVNPTNAAIDLSDVYLTDATYGLNSTFYWHISDGVPTSNNTGGGAFNDFHGRFPDHYIIAPLDTIVIAINGSTQYFEAYGQLPDFELYEDDSVPDTVPELVAVFPGSIHSGDPLGELDTGLFPTLSDGSESLILYQWDGASDLVTDLDYMYWGTDVNVRIDKTGETVGAMTYLPDTGVLFQEPVSISEQNFGQAYARLNADEGTENASGGNGLTGHDETSENLGTTWQIAASQSPPAAPAEHFATAPIIIGGAMSPYAPYVGQMATLSLEIASFGTVSGVVFFHAANSADWTPSVGNDQGGGIWSASVPGQPEGTEVTWYAVVANSAGGTATWPAAAPSFSIGWTVEPLPDVPSKLLITEVNAGRNYYPVFEGMENIASEFIEIHNPNDVAVALDNYYLTDAISYLYTVQVYWRIASDSPPTQLTVGGGIYNDFTARFPAGYSIEPEETITISVAGSGWFEGYYGRQPDLELYEDGDVPDEIPDMRPVFTNPPEDLPGDSIYTANRDPSSDGLPRGIPELEEYYGEPVILYHWAPGLDLVTDIDVFIWGDAKIGTYRVGFDKTGVTVNASTYQPDTPVVEQDWFIDVDNSGFSYSRSDTGEGWQPTSGGNGVDGRDETGENLSVTFAVTVPNPGYYTPGSIFAPEEGAWQDVAYGPLADDLDNQAHAWGDYDNDGDDDLYLVRGAGNLGNTLLMNFTDQGFAEMSSNLRDTGGGTDASWGDINNDGYLDIILSNSDGPNRIYWNIWHLGSLWEFSPEMSSNLDQINQSVAVDFIDFDHDGRIEAYVSNEDGPNQMLLGRFAFLNMVPSGLDFPGPTGGFQWCDIDGDLDPDLGMVSQTGITHVLTQAADGEFQDLALSMEAIGTTCTWSDFDNDGDFDAFVTSQNEANVLYENLGAAGFQVIENSAFPGTAHSLSGIWGDYDNDGYTDIYVINRDGANQLLHNEAGSGQFTAVTDSLLAIALQTTCATWSDIDDDGDVDLYVSNVGSANQLIRNNLDNGNNWLTVKVEGNPGGTQANRSAIGATIRLDTDQGSQWRYVTAGSGHAGQSPFEQYFGLGTAANINRLTIYWPYILPWGYQHTTVMENVAPNQKLLIVEDTIGPSPVVDDSGIPAVFKLGISHPNPFNPRTTIPFELPRAVSVDLRVFDLRGHLVRTLVAAESVSAGSHDIIWNGCDESGREVAAGVYLVKIVAGTYESSQRVTLVK